MGTEAEYQSSMLDGIDKYGSTEHNIAEYVYRKLCILSNLAGTKRSTKKKYNNKYVIVQDSRKNNKHLLLVDRRKSKKYWWTLDLSIALIGSKEELTKVLDKLKYNNPRILSVQVYLHLKETE